jgi:hypothetical protein
MSKVEAAKTQLREIARDLEAVRYRFLGVHASVPLSPAESDPLADVDVTTDPVAHLHGSLEDFLDEIESLISDVLETASSPSEPEGEKE